MPTQTLRTAAAALGLAVIVGCSSEPSPVVVKGSFTNAGKAVAASNQDGVAIIFVPVGGSTSYPARFVHDENRYEVAGPSQMGILPGKYRVSINIMTSKPPAPGNSAINASFSLDKTPIEVEVPPDGKLDIDLANFKPR